MGNNSKIKEKVRQLPNKPGVYIMRDVLGRVLYVGKAKNLKKRISTYFYPIKRFQLQEIQPKIAVMISLVDDFETIVVKSEAEAIILESQLIKQWKPKYNTLAKDDKQFFLVKVDIQNQIPQFRLTRNRSDNKSLYFGPFINSYELKKTLKDLRIKYGILLGDTYPQKIGENLFRLYDDARAEIYQHSNEVTVQEYQERVKKACEFLEGKSDEYIKDIEIQMSKASASQDYEKAATLRDLLFAAQTTREPSRKFLNLRFEDKNVAMESLVQLSEALGFKHVIHNIECFDISHISGTFLVASMVHFTGGKPDKGQYRRYKIRGFIGNDDYRAMQEVIVRRYSRLFHENLPFPDLIIIDGGKGQVNAALSAFLVFDFAPPVMIGLAKRKETIVFSDDRPNLNLPLNSQALHLLQRIRDEAHRFANSFNAELRSKKIRESILDEFTGLGPVRKEALLKHFGSLQALRKASVKDLQTVSGIGPKTAKDLYEFLRKN